MAGGEGPACNEILLFCILYRLNVTVHVISRQEDTLGVTLNLANESAPTDPWRAKLEAPMTSAAHVIAFVCGSGPLRLKRDLSLLSLAPIKELRSFLAIPSLCLDVLVGT